MIPGVRPGQGVFYVGPDSQGTRAIFRARLRRGLAFHGSRSREGKARCVRVVLDQARTTESSRGGSSNDLLMAPHFRRRRGLLTMLSALRGSPGDAREKTTGSGSPTTRKFHGSKGVNLRLAGGPTRAWFTSSRANGRAQKPLPGAEYYYIRDRLHGGAFTTRGCFRPSTGLPHEMVRRCRQGPRSRSRAETVERRRGLAACGMAQSLPTEKDKENYRGYFIRASARATMTGRPHRAPKVMEGKETPDDRFDRRSRRSLTSKSSSGLDRRIVPPTGMLWGGERSHGYLFSTEHGRGICFPLMSTTPQQREREPLLPPTGCGPAHETPGRGAFTSGSSRTTRRVYWSPVTAKPFLDAVQAATGVPTASIRTYSERT